MNSKNNLLFMMLEIIKIFKYENQAKKTFVRHLASIWNKN